MGIKISIKGKWSLVVPIHIIEKSMTDSIENIQERTAGSMSAASAGARLAAASASTSKHGVLV